MSVLEFFQFGVPTVILAVFLAGAGWLGRRLIPRIERGIDTNIDLMKALQEHLPRQTAAIDTQTGSIVQLLSKTDEQTNEIKLEHRLLDTRTALFAEIKERLDRIEKRLHLDAGT